MTMNNENPTGPGGPRPGAGRKPSGRKQYTVRMRPPNWEKLEAKAKAKDLTVGEYLEKLNK